MAYNERVDVFSFGLTLLEVILGDCKYIKYHFKGMSCVVSKAKGGLGWRPPVPDVLARCARNPSSSSSSTTAFSTAKMLDPRSLQPSFRTSPARSPAPKFAVEQLLQDLHALLDVLVEVRLSANCLAAIIASARSS